MAGSVRIRAQILKEMLLHARSEPQIECCGLLGGRGGVITSIFPTENALGSATAYEIAPKELFRLFRSMLDQGLTHMGIYHSHPATENVPSPSDIEQSYYPDQVYFIISPRAGATNPIRAFSIRGGGAGELEIEEVSDGSDQRTGSG
jgi:[CysO sulfur-carrier protein]-S-L-cysteine hydrolase